MSDASLLHWFSTLPPAIERYELKYVIPLSLVEPISACVAAYCEYDDHSLGSVDRFYDVNSLYFDSPSCRFLKQRIDGVDRRYNVRVRSYGDGTKGPYFAEVKYKKPTSTKKFRATLHDSEWPSFIQQGNQQAFFTGISDKERNSRQLFAYIAEAYAIEPKIFTCYRRRAFSSRIDDYARVTFDMDLRYRQQDPHCSSEPYSLRPCKNCINYDVETAFGDEQQWGGSVVMELKATIGAVPVWMLDLVRRFELKQIGFSKYMSSSLVLNYDNGLRYMANDRVMDLPTV